MGLLQLEVFLAVLQVDAAEGGGDLGAETAAVEGEDARVARTLLLSFHIIDSNTAAAAANTTSEIEETTAVLQQVFSRIRGY